MTLSLIYWRRQTAYRQLRNITCAVAPLCALPRRHWLAPTPRPRFWRCGDCRVLPKCPLATSWTASCRQIASLQAATAAHRELLVPERITCPQARFFVPCIESTEKPLVTLNNGLGVFVAKKRVFISFDYDHDRTYRYLLKALAANRRVDLDFDDLTPEEIDSSDVSRVKAVLTTKIRQATHTLVIIGAHANSYHPDREAIGERNWQWWEIEKSASEDKGFIAVRIAPQNATPTPLYRKGATWANSFSVDSIIRAIDEA